MQRGKDAEMQSKLEGWKARGQEGWQSLTKRAIPPYLHTSSPPVATPPPIITETRS